MRWAVKDEMFDTVCVVLATRACWEDYFANVE